MGARWGMPEEAISVYEGPVGCVIDGGVNLAQRHSWTRVCDACEASRSHGSGADEGRIGSDGGTASSTEERGAACAVPPESRVGYSRVLANA